MLKRIIFKIKISINNLDETLANLTLNEVAYGINIKLRKDEKNLKNREIKKNIKTALCINLKCK